MEEAEKIRLDRLNRLSKLNMVRKEPKYTMEEFLEGNIDLKYMTLDSTGREECIQKLLEFIEKQGIDEEVVRDITHHSTGTIVSQFNLEEIKQIPEKVYDYYNSLPLGDRMRFKLAQKLPPKLDERPDLSGILSFPQFLDKYPICKQISAGKNIKIGFKLNKEKLIYDLLEFFEDQGIDESAYKIIMGKKDDTRDLKSQLEDLNIEQLKGIPYKVYNSLYTARVKNSQKKPKTKRNNKRKKRKHTRKKKKSQKGGFTPCIPCLGPIFAGAGLSATGYMMSSSSSSSNINGKRSVKRKEKYQITKNGKTHKREFKQMNKRVYDGKKMSEYDNLKQANEAYNSLIKKCKSKGFQKC